MEALLSGLSMAINPEAILAVIIGCVVGIVIGAIPGLTFTMGIVLLLPLTFALPPIPAMALLLGVYIGGMTGGSVSAILLGIPGTPSAAATVLDGHPMAKKGQAGKALGMAVIASVFGGIISLVVMMLISSQLANLALKFGPAEIFALVVFGFATICGISESSVTRGLIAGTLGLMVMTIGMDPIVGVPRMTFGSTDLLQGVDLVVAMIGMFAIPQVFRAFLHRDEEVGGLDTNVKADLPTWRELRQNFWLMLRCALLGTGIGAVPGTGGPVAAFLAYDHARRFSKHPERFGSGELAGVVGPETANNAVTGGALIPLLSLGIPGDPTTAVMMGGLLIHGLRPGPLLFKENMPQVYGLYITILLANLVTLVVQLYGIRFFVRVLKLPAEYVTTAIVVMCGVGAYTIRNSIFDVYVMAIAGLFGYVLQRLRIPVTPVILALVLGVTIESEYRRALIMTQGSHMVFFESVVAVLFLGLTVMMIGFQAFSAMRKARKARKARMETEAVLSD